MEQLYLLLDNWAKCSGLSAVIVDAQGCATSSDFGLTDFCALVKGHEGGLKTCTNTWKSSHEGIYICPIGLRDFSIPITLPDGTLLGRVMAGQALLAGQDEEEILRNVVALGIDEEEAREKLAGMHRKTQREMDGAYSLLKEMLGFFIEKSYDAWKAASALREAPARQDRTLSQITQIMYSYNLTIDVETGAYSLITGTGMRRTVDEYKRHSRHDELRAFQDTAIDPAYLGRFHRLTCFDPEHCAQLEDGYRGSMEYPVRYPDSNETEWHEVNVFIGTEEDGRRVANVLGRDVTQAHLAQEQRENEARAAAAKDQILSELTKTLYSYNATVNLNTGKMSLIVGTGMDEFVEQIRLTDDYEKGCEVLLSRALPEFPKEMNRRFSLEALRKQSNKRGHIGQMEYAAQTSEGVGWFEVNAFMGVDEEGNPTANILGRDVTEAHNALERRENELRAAAAKDAILSSITKTLYSYNLTLHLVSGRYSLIVGTGMDEFVEIFESTNDYETAYQRKKEYVTQETLEDFEAFSSLEALRQMAEHGDDGYQGKLEYSVETERGIEWHEVNVFLGSDENGEPVANILGRDVTEAHNEADTRAQLEIAKASSAAKTAFLFNMSHDIRTPMNAIIGFTELLNKHLDEPELARAYIAKIQASNEFLLSLINNVLEMARIESGKETLDEVYWDAYEFNDSLFALFDSQMREKGIEFTRSTQVEHPKIICDETKLREIFLNILSNALKYTPSGGRVTMTLTELPSALPGYAMYQTVIEDTGIGMSEDFLPHIFEEFTRERSSTESRVTGTGLGMPIVQKLVDLMKGTVEVESQVGKGTRFTVTLPHRIAAAEDPAREERQVVACQALDFTGRRILLAEDNDLNAEIASAILEESGFEVERAEDGVICVDMLSKAAAGSYDLILMDIQMPNMNGYRAAQTIRKLPDEAKASIPIIAMTANAFEEDRRNAFAAGMNDHVAKPFRVDELLGALARALPSS
ncbi:MAG: ATP-binding protein [Coriobacteriales bacterium]